MDFQDFARRYLAPPVEVGFNSTTLGNASILDSPMNTLDQIRLIRTAWYTPQMDERYDFADRNKKNMTVGEVADNRSLVPTHVDRINAWVERIKAGESVPLIAPAYALPNGEFFLLDGNHRLVAAVIAGKSPVLLHVVQGPVSRAIVPDLWRWEAE